MSIGVGVVAGLLVAHLFAPVFWEAGTFGFFFVSVVAGSVATGGTQVAIESFGRKSNPGSSEFIKSSEGLPVEESTEQDNKLVVKDVYDELSPWMKVVYHVVSISVPFAFGWYGRVFWHFIFNN